METLYDQKLLRKTLIAGIIISFLLLLNRPYAFYSLGKLLIFGINIYVITYLFKYESGKRTTQLLFLAILIVVFNPIFPVFAEKPSRRIFDILNGINLIYIYLLFNKDHFIIRTYKVCKRQLRSFFKGI